VEMKIGQGCLIAGDRRQEKLFPERGIRIPAGLQFVALLKTDALDIPWAKRCDDACNCGRNAQHLGGDARIRAGRMPGQGESFDAEFACCLLWKGRPRRNALPLGGGSTFEILPPLQAVKSHLNQQERALGRTVSCGFIKFDPEFPEGTHDLKCLAPARAQFLQHLQGSIVQGVDEIECLHAGPFPGGQGISGIVFVSGHVVIVGVAPRAQIQGLSGFVSKTWLAQRSASWKIGSEENSEDISSLCV
jgi:hypothetical protein